MAQQTCENCGTILSRGVCPWCDEEYFIQGIDEDLLFPYGHGVTSDPDESENEPEPDPQPTREQVDTNTSMSETERLLERVGKLGCSVDVLIYIESLERRIAALEQGNQK